MPECDFTCMWNGVSPENAKMIISEIAKQGAREALKEIGLADDDAGEDVKSLREMLKDWRTMKRGILGTLARGLGWVALIALAVKFGFGDYLKGFKP